MSSQHKRRFIRTALSPSVAPKSKTITPAMEAELAKRTQEWERRQQPKPK
jgi:hypothetical protein